MKIQFFAALGVSALVVAACGSGDFTAQAINTRQIEFVVNASSLGSPAARQPFSAEAANQTTFNLIAHRPDGAIDYAFNGWVRISVKPGTVDTLTAPDPSQVSGRNVRLVDGVAMQITASYRGTFGDATLLATDLGYSKDAPDSVARACSDGLDNNGNGLVDYPADPGCEAADDNSEDGGSYAMWASPVIYYTYPRISDVRGRERSGASTPFKFQQVQLDTGYRRSSKGYDFKLIVTRISANGFYVTDLNDTRGYSSVFFYNFSSPPGMRVCDRIREIAGTATEFYGSVQMSFPSWQLEPWQPPTFEDGTPNPKGWECEVPDAVHLLPSAIAVPKTMLGLVHAVVKAEAGSTTDADNVAHTLGVYVSSAFGPEFPEENPTYKSTARTYPDNSRYLMKPNASNCDFNGNGTVDFDVKDEADCSASCDRYLHSVDDPTRTGEKITVPGTTSCTEYSNYLSRHTFRVVVVDQSVKNGLPVLSGDSVQADLSTVPQADPFALRGKPIQTLRGTLNYFSGGSQFTIQARCSDDFAELGTVAKSITTACIHPRTAKELEDTN